MNRVLILSLHEHHLQRTGDLRLHMTAGDDTWILKVSGTRVNLEIFTQQGSRIILSDTEDDLERAFLRNAVNQAVLYFDGSLESWAANVRLHDKYMGTYPLLGGLGIILLLLVLWAFHGMCSVPATSALTVFFLLTFLAILNYNRDSYLKSEAALQVLEVKASRNVHHAEQIQTHNILVKIQENLNASVR